MNNGIGLASPGLQLYKAVYFLDFLISSILETTPKPNNRNTQQPEHHGPTQAIKHAWNWYVNDALGDNQRGAGKIADM